MIHRISISLIVMALIATAACCSRSNPDRRLEKVAELVDSSPASALLMLDSIDRSGLSVSDRHYHDFLTLKGQDKTYVTHTSDSLILDLLSYYKDHNEPDIYPEVLYYGGRVYSDLGDYPTALGYFQDALDHLQDGDMQLSLSSRIYSQSGRLRFYSNMRYFCLNLQ